MERGAAVQEARVAATAAPWQDRAVEARRGSALVCLTLAGVLLSPASPARAAPLGDGRIATSGPAPGQLLACAPPRALPPPALPWISGGRYHRDREPVVDGAIRWPEAAFRVDPGRTGSVFTGNGLPVGKPSGAFPVGPDDDAAPYAGDAAAPRITDLRGTIPGAPRAGRPHCVSARLPVGVARSGVPILPPHTPTGRDAVALEVNDACGGRTDPAGRYYYRAGLGCLLPSRPRPAHSRQVGWARDGFAIHGPLGAGGERLRSRHLDACHGHTHAVTAGGRRRVAYHYHLTADFPYTLGCFRARPAGDWTSAPGAASPTGGEGPAAAAAGAASAPAAPADTPTSDDAPPPEPDARDDVTLTASPSLQPAWDPRATDYVVRCQDGEPVELTADAPAGVQIGVDGQTARGGTQRAEVELSESQGFEVTVTSSRGSRAYHVRCLPSDFPAYTVTRAGVPQAQWYVVSPTLSLDPNSIPGFFTAGFDAHGAPVWWRRGDLKNPMYDARLLPGNQIVWSTFANGEYPYTFRDLDGTVTRTLATVGVPTDLHDIQPLANGNYMLMSYPTRDHVDLSPYGGPSDALVLDAEIQEVTPSGQLVWSWNSKDHIALEETGRWYDAQVIRQPQPLPDGRRAYDIVHINSVEADGDGYLVSMRHTDSVYRVRRSDGSIDWKLGGTATPESLDVQGDHYSEPLGGQHDARVLPGGQVSIADNGTGLGRAPRAVVYRIDRALRTATLTEEVTDPRAPSSFCCGSARRLSGGNWVMGWGSRSFFTELSPSGEPVLTVDFPGLFTYRAAPLEPGTVAAADLRAGMDAMHPR